MLEIYRVILSQIIHKANIYEFLIQFFMGLRIVECLALSTSDIDLANKRMYVHRTLTTDLNGRVIMSKSTQTKTDDNLLGDETIVVDSKEYNIEDNIKEDNNAKEIDEKYER